MSQDIIAMAREAGAWSQQSKNCDVEYVMSEASLERFAALVRAAEREACAKVCENIYEYDEDVDTYYSEIYASAIRARGGASIRRNK